MGSTALDESHAVAVDSEGNAYATGFTRGSLYGANDTGHSDAFLVKYDTSGSVLWSRQIGSVSDDESHSVAVDMFGNAYISGHTLGDFGGTRVGSWDAFLTKYDALGNHLWSRQFGTELADFIRSVAVDAVGNAYVTGYTTVLTDDGFSGSEDVTLAKFDASGNQLWSRQIGTTEEDYGLSVAVDAVGNAYITGLTEGNLGGANAGRTDAFLLKYDTAGNVVWSRQFGTYSTDDCFSVAVDGAGNVYTSGRTGGAFDGMSAGIGDAFLTKFDESGTHLWSRQIGTSRTDDSYSVAVDAAGDVFISGYTDGNLDGENIGHADAFLAKYDSLGNHLWSRQVGTASPDFSLAVAVDAHANAYISGYTRGAFGGANAGYDDAFLVKFVVPEPTSMTLAGLTSLLIACATSRRRKNAPSNYGATIQLSIRTKSVASTC
jgi:hypothetical protein